jgi:XTP/dITP diphosphohydrolase
MRRIVIASNNRDKGREIGRMLRGLGVRLVGGWTFPDVGDVRENGRTYRENAAKKALAFALHTGCWALADDSGLEVDALCGRPGLRSARYAGPGGSYERNRAKVLQAMKGVPAAQRRAVFRCSLALAGPDGTVKFFDGECPGRITLEMSGTSGFGYDPVFEAPSKGKTFAQMSAQEKDSISHRGRALRKFRVWLEKILSRP